MFHEPSFCFFQTMRFLPRKWICLPFLVKNHESCLGGRHGYPHGEGYGPIGIERESDSDPDNLFLAPVRNVRPISGHNPARSASSNLATESGNQEPRKRKRNLWRSRQRFMRRHELTCCVEAFCCAAAVPPAFSGHHRDHGV